MSVMSVCFTRRQRRAYTRCKCGDTQPPLRAAVPNRQNRHNRSGLSAKHKLDLPSRPPLIAAVDDELVLPGDVFLHLCQPLAQPFRAYRLGVLVIGRDFEQGGAKLFVFVYAFVCAPAKNGFVSLITSLT